MNVYDVVRRPLAEYTLGLAGIAMGLGSIKWTAQIGDYMKPTYTHDCDECVLIATLIDPEQNVDIYRCEQRGSPTWIGRYGDSGSEYISIPESMIGAVEGRGITALLQYVYIRHLRQTTDR